MPSLALVRKDAVERLIPEDACLRMIERCARDLREATTLPSVLRAISQAEAIDAVTRKINASKEIRRDSYKLLIDAERQLGDLTSKIPHHDAKTGTPSKKSVLKAHDLRVNRCLMAERLARTPDDALEAALAIAKNKSVSGVETVLGIKNPGNSWANKTERNLDFLANEAIDLLELSIKTQRLPAVGNVAEMRNRLHRLRVFT